MNNLNIDKTIDCVTKIVDNNRCPICDKNDGQRMRYPCGHTACDDCVIDREDCEICLLVPETPTGQPKPDDAFTQRVKSSTSLLKACEDLFHMDVYSRKRLSEQLRVEKELFPKCIQAPIKYENKRKSTIFSSKNKENRQSEYFSGEKTSPFKDNMESSISYVQQWLNKNVEARSYARKPLTDINVNKQFNTYIRNKNDEVLELHDNKKSTRKRSHFKTTTKNDSLLSIKRKNTMISDRNIKRVKKELHEPSKSNQLLEKPKECDYDESGIFLDNDATSVIDDSQEASTDKDINAWHAVLKASEIESTSVVDRDSGDNTSTDKLNKQFNVLQCKEDQRSKVPFYKKSYITETCTRCYNLTNNSEPSKEVKITINDERFTTIINILSNLENNFKNNINRSVSVQTDISEAIQTKDISNGSKMILKDTDGEDSGVHDSLQKSFSVEDTKSEDLFIDEVKNISNEYDKKTKNTGVVIEESESDTDVDESGPLPVTVDVHRSCDESEYGILGELVNMQEHDMRPRRGPRGLTPTSTDSSEKENFDPNRTKRSNPKKKKKQ